MAQGVASAKSKLLFLIPLRSKTNWHWRCWNRHSARCILLQRVLRKQHGSLSTEASGTFDYYWLLESGFEAFEGTGRRTSKRVTVFCGRESRVRFSPSFNTLKFPGIPTLPRLTFKGGTETCALCGPLWRFPRSQKPWRYLPQRNCTENQSKNTKPKKSKPINSPQSATETLKLFPWQVLIFLYDYRIVVGK